MLEQRWQKYSESGLQGIRPYDRGAGKITDSANELKFAALNHEVLINFFPKLREIWLKYPDVQLNDVNEKYFLVNRLVLNRPTAVLVHRISQVSAAGAIMLSRQFYVEHAYNANQITIICFPYLNGTLLFYLNQSFTDQVTGFGSSLKRSVGREQKRRRMEAHLKKLNHVLRR